MPGELHSCGVAWRLPCICRELRDGHSTLSAHTTFLDAYIGPVGVETESVHPLQDSEGQVWYAGV